jgi:hypothetical protein
MTDSELQLKWLQPDEVQDNPLNWREHPEYQTAALDDLIFGEDGVGWAGVGLVNDRREEDGWMSEEAVPTLIDGHDRKKVAAERGEAMPVLIGSWSPDDERKILLTLDPIASLAKTKTKELGQLLSSIQATTAPTRKLVDLITVSQLRVKEAKPDEVSDETMQAVATGSMPDKIYHLALNQLVPNSWSAHAMSGNEYARLVRSVESIGFIEPFVVRPIGDGKFEIVDGMQRYRVAVDKDMETVPCLIRHYDEDAAKLASLASNRLRGKFIPKRLAEILTDVRDTHGDELVTKTIGMEKKRMDSFGEASGYEYKVDEGTGVVERDYREYGVTDYSALDEKLTLIVGLESEDFHLVEEALNEISPNWGHALPVMVRQWREYVPQEVIDEPED